MSEQIAAIRLPSELHPDTRLLIVAFAEAMAQRLYRSQDHYGITNAWTHAEHASEFRDSLARCVNNGDTRGVAICCAFLWWHCEKTVPPPAEDGDDDGGASSSPSRPAAA